MAFKATAASPLPQQTKQAFQNIFADQATGSYLLLSLGMGAVAALLPVALVVLGGYPGHYSISYFYHVSDLTRNVLVGALWATGTFLFLFHGLSRLENWILNAAGVFGVMVAMNPMAAQQCGGAERAVSLHALSAIAFFLCLAVVAIGLSKGRIRYLPQERLRKRFKLAYNAAGVAMIAMPVAVGVIHFLTRRGCDSHFIFWIEAFGIWAFAAFWFVKTYEYRLLLGVTVASGDGSDASHPG